MRSERLHERISNAVVVDPHVLVARVPQGVEDRALRVGPIFLAEVAVARVAVVTAAVVGADVDADGTARHGARLHLRAARPERPVDREAVEREAEHAARPASGRRARRALPRARARQEGGGAPDAVRQDGLTHPRLARRGPGAQGDLDGPHRRADLLEADRVEGRVLQLRHRRSVQKMEQSHRSRTILRNKRTLGRPAPIPGKRNDSAIGLRLRISR